VIYTIGYGNRSFDTMAFLLQRYAVNTLADVRSHPYSRHNPNFNKNVLSAKLDALRIVYVFLGQLLGGKPADPQFYTDGIIDYAKLSGAACFHSGIQQLEVLVSGGKNLAVMCSELRPEGCHRTRLVTPELIVRGYQVTHIDQNGNLLTHLQVVARWDSSTQPPLL
jgi:uncharacterized protein (DUF488 family)